MGLFGADFYTCRAKIRCPFTFSEPEKVRQPTLMELAEEKFGSDRNLILQLQTFLDSCKQKHQYPTRLAWSMQLQLLEKFPAGERVKQVVTSIMRGYRAIAYEGNLKKVNKITREKEDDINIITDIAY